MEKGITTGSITWDAVMKGTLAAGGEPSAMERRIREIVREELAALLNGQIVGRAACEHINHESQRGRNPLPKL